MLCRCGANFCGERLCCHRHRLSVVRLASFTPCVFSFGVFCGGCAALVFCRYFSQRLLRRLRCLCFLQRFSSASFKNRSASFPLKPGICQKKCTLINSMAEMAKMWIYQKRHLKFKFWCFFLVWTTVKSPPPRMGVLAQNFPTLAPILWGDSISYRCALQAPNPTLAPILREGTPRPSLGGDFAV